MPADPEITHEALIRCWLRLRDWLAEDREGLRLHRQLTEATGAWESLHRDPGVLYRGTELIPGADRFVRELRDRDIPFAESAQAAFNHVLSWTSAASLAEARDNHTATLLSSGQVLVAGGFDDSSNTALASTERLGSCDAGTV